jgi:hypothetical protein
MLACGLGFYIEAFSLHESPLVHQIRLSHYHDNLRKVTIGL